MVGEGSHGTNMEGGYLIMGRYGRREVAYPRGACEPEYVYPYMVACLVASVSCQTLEESRGGGGGGSLLCINL